MSQSEKTILKFGIPGFDGLFNNRDPKYSHGGRKILNPDFNKCGITIPGNEASSICLIGPDGVGKSVFAMHLASRYSAEQSGNKKKPFVFYISTDLNHKIALEMWKNFALDDPSAERDPFSTNSGVAGAAPIGLQSAKPDDLDDILIEPAGQDIIFVDLAANTAGDDWGFLHRFISVLEKPAENEPKHLIIIDAVEGFETYVGELDAFGEKTSRRARIAQIMKLVKDKSHVLLVVEETRTHERLPEEFVTDVVIRLNKDYAKGYIRRTVEIEKARGQYYARGSHHYTIRNGKGSTTGGQENADDPKFNPKNEGEPEEFFQSYVFLPHSLHYFHRTIMEREGTGRPDTPRNKYAAFGIEYLDNMLGGEGEETRRLGGYDSRGVPAGTITTLVGDTLTQKSRLGKAFLSQCFSSVVDIYREMRDSQSIQINDRNIFERIYGIFEFKQPYPQGLYDDCLAKIKNLNWLGVIQSFSKYTEQLLAQKARLEEDPLLKSKNEWLKSLVIKFKKVEKQKRLELFREWLIKNDNGTAVMLTTNDISHTDLVEKFADLLKQKYIDDEPELREYLRDNLIAYMKKNTICRRIEIHDVSSSTMLNIFSKTIWEAQKRLLEDQFVIYSQTFDRLGRIRVVIDDFSSFRNIYSDITEDSLLLPSIKFILGRSSVTSLIIDTQTGKPDFDLAEKFASELRQMSDNILYTWRVPFYGENRVAIAAIPPLSSDNAGIVRELRWDTKSDTDALMVDPHFEMYLGLEEGKPQPVPLEVRLFTDVSYFDSYIDEENLLLSEIFVPVKIVQGVENNKIIIKFPNTKYDVMRNMSYLQRDTRLDHTVVVGVDEFWGKKLPLRRRSGSFRPQWKYLDSITRKNKLGNSDTDPYLLFQNGHVTEVENEVAKRRRHFIDNNLGYNLIDFDPDEVKNIERVPYSWDFGFILLKTDAWLRSAEKTVHIQGQATKISEIWEKLIKIPEGKNESEGKAQQNTPAAGRNSDLTWREFLDACQNVAEAESSRLGEPVPAFDSSLVTPETFSCLFLEIWASEIFLKLKKADRENGADSDESKIFSDSISNRSWTEKKTPSLINWLESPTKYSMELYKTWLLLVDVLNFSEITKNSSFGNFEFNTRLASNSAVAVRLWYKTACQWVETNSRSDAITAVRLPGNFSVRGDWFLSVAGGSRSTRLGERILDILCSRRANIVRLQNGLGLPTRYLNNSEKLRTRLVLNGKYGISQNVEYKDLKKIGKNESDDFFWLWRSSLNDYHRHSRAWHKWLNRVMHWWFEKKLQYQSSWDPGFVTYDNLSTGAKTREGEDVVQEEFFKLCDVLKDELINAGSEN